MFSFPAYVLIGDDKTGKTNFQKALIENLCHVSYVKLPRNLPLQIVHPRMPRGHSVLMSMNRSFQENLNEYVDMDNYFRNYFKDGDICIMSSHTHDPSITHLREMIEHLKVRCYNPKAVFFSNGFDDKARDIAALDWNERLWVENPYCDTEDKFLIQIKRLAEEFANMLIARASVE